MCIWNGCTCWGEEWLGFSPVGWVKPIGIKLDLVFVTFASLSAPRFQKPPLLNCNSGRAGLPEGVSSLFCVLRLLLYLCCTEGRSQCSWVPPSRICRLVLASLGKGDMEHFLLCLTTSLIQALCPWDWVVRPSQWYCGDPNNRGSLICVDPGHTPTFFPEAATPLYRNKGIFVFVFAFFVFCFPSVSPDAMGLPLWSQRPSACLLTGGLNVLLHNGDEVEGSWWGFIAFLQHVAALVWSGYLSKIL